ncbi:hypothetical protein N7448_002259 [Penicillium atrosanguineum]|uniref:CWF11 family n=1 Tax=Penicillium atrosanguineum TaxID=1132637 RepID=UPI00239CE797|nr:CWF11 family [Penicillium atrosanguineum]KAJ5128540.1 hypothetical protein N7526_006706 [Penicillium atrosanguineum]KAJ5144867.1 hypothetical protein N7448_002259 [Penicillium atrosanguineum]KAJ5300660.1 CWF11 family [Penicillium atrosanguineum]
MSKGFFPFEMFKQQRQESFDSSKSAKSLSKPSSAAPSRSHSIQSEPVDIAATPVAAAPVRPKVSRNWSFGRVLDEEEKKRRRDSQDEQDRLAFAATRKYSSCQRRSQGAGVNFQSGWQ